MKPQPKFSRQKFLNIIRIFFIIPFIANLTFSLVPPKGARASGIIYVNESAAGANDGTSWADAFTSLQSALTSALAGDEIWVAAGVYYPGNSRTDTFTLKTGVAVYGSFTGTETARYQRRLGSYNTVLSGDIDPLGNNDSYHVLTGSATDGSAILDGFFVTAGRADGTGPHNSGGGLYNALGSPTLRNVIFKGNSAVVGGAIYNRDSSPTLVHTVIVNNSATDGGGVYNTNSSPTFINNTFYGNGVTKNGSAMANLDNSSPTITNSILWGNKSPSIHQIYNLNSTSNISYTDMQGPPQPGLGNLNSDPLYSNPSGGDLRLNVDSPVIDAGNNNALPADTNDLDGDGNITELLPYDASGNSRLIDSPTKTDSGAGASPLVDMGAYEYLYPNNASVLDTSGDPFLSAIDEDDTGNTGSLVSEILASGAGGNPISDPESSTQVGIAVISVDNSNGLWQYSTNGGQSWINFGILSDTSAVLLATDAQVRFVPALNFHGSLDPGITFRAWDGSDGRASGNASVDVSSNGGTTAYSAQIETASITVYPVNDFPEISAIADQSISIGQSLGPIAFTIDDVDNPLSSLQLSGASSNTSLVPGASMVFAGSGANRTVSIPANFAIGSTTITVTLSDGKVSVTETFELTVQGFQTFLPAVRR